MDLPMLSGVGVGVALDVAMIPTPQKNQCDSGESTLWKKEVLEM